MPLSSAPSADVNDEIELMFKEMSDRAEKLRFPSDKSDKSYASNSFGKRSVKLEPRVLALMKSTLTNEALLAFMKIFDSPHYIIKIFWSLTLLAANGLCAYLIMETIFTYLSYGVNSTTRNVVENPTDFPKVR